jgi:hypothetical protein
MIERKIMIGMITSTSFLQQIQPYYFPRLIESSAFKRLASWCFKYFKDHNTAPGKEIELMLLTEAKRLEKDVAEEIEEILEGLSNEYENENENPYLVSQTIKYFKERQILELTSTVEKLTSAGQLEEAEKLMNTYSPLIEGESTEIIFDNPAYLPEIKKAFNQELNQVFTLPYQLGDFMNDQLGYGKFIAFLAPEKRGKTFLLLYLAMQACRQGKNVVFFQAGDMNKIDQTQRIGIYLTKTSNQEKYCKEHYEPIRDCVHNQLGTCEELEKEITDAPFEEKTYEDIRGELIYEELVDAYENYPKHIPCHNCTKYWQQKYGAVWLKKIPKTDPLSEEQYVRAINEFFIKKHHKLRLDTYSNGTLSVNKALAVLDKWEREDGFVPDLIIFDYADLMVPSVKAEFRHQQNEIWKDLRRVSQTERQGIFPLVITATQADAASYETNSLRMKNFSEDKRKYGHVTVLYGLNQDPQGKEKKIGIMRINELVKREGSFHPNKEVYILQNLRRGRAVIQSYF